MVVTFTASNVAAIAGMHPYRKKVDALRECVDSGSNAFIRDGIGQCAGVKIPSIVRAERAARSASLAAPSVVEYGKRTAVEPKEEREAKKEAVTVGEAAFRSEVAKLAPESHCRVDVEKAAAIVAKRVSSMPACQRGIEQEAAAAEAMGETVHHITDKSDMKEIILEVGTAFDSTPASSRRERAIRYRIIGRADAEEDLPDGTKAVVEIKTRQKKLMEPRYDQVQLAVYMLLYRRDRGILAQRLGTSIHKSEPYPFDVFAELWTKVKAKLDEVVLILVEAMTVPSLAKKFLSTYYPYIEVAEGGGGGASAASSAASSVASSAAPSADEVASIMRFIKTVSPTAALSLPDGTIPRPRSRSPPPEEVEPVSPRLTIPPPTVLVKLIHKDAKMPEKGTPGAIGYDLYACEDGTIPNGGRGLIGTGVQLEISPFVVHGSVSLSVYGRIAPRSGIAFRDGIGVGAGVIDPDYRGELKVLLFNHGDVPFVVKAGMRIAQIIFETVAPVVLSSVGSLSESDRAAGGFGSTGK